MTDPRIQSASPGKGSFGSTLLWIIAFGVGWGMFTHEFAGVAIGGVMGFLAGQIFALREQLGNLTERLLQLERKASAVRPVEPQQPVTQDLEADDHTEFGDEEVIVVPPPGMSWDPTHAPTITATTSAAMPPLVPASSPIRAPSQPAAPSAFNAFVDKSIAGFMAWLKGGNPLARVGVFVLFCGGAFLAKYASEAGLFPIEFRLMALAAGAMTLLGVGWWLRERQRLYALTLQGGGVAILYLTVFVALKMYHLVGPGFALPLLIVIALSAAVLAVSQNAMSMAVIGFSGGFLAPILASNGAGNHIALFSYYTALNVGLFAIAWFRAWRVLNLVGFIFTFGIAGTFRAMAYKPEDMVSTDFFVILFFLMYVGVSVLFAIRQPPKLKGYVSSSLVFGLPVAAFALQASLLKQVEFGLAFSALGYGIFYLALAWTLYLSKHPNLRLLTEAFAALGIIFASLAVPAAFDKQTTSAMWAVEGAGLLWLGARQDRKIARIFGVTLQLLGGAGFLMGLHELSSGRAILNSAYIGTLMLAVAGLLSGLWLYRTISQRAKYEENWDVIAALWGTGWWTFGGLREMDRFLDHSYSIGGDLAFAALTLLALHGLGAWKSWPMPGRIAQGLLPIAIILGFAIGVDHSHPFALMGYAGWPLLFAAGYWLLYRQDRAPDDMLEILNGWLHPFVLCALGLIASWESGWRIAQQVGGVWPVMPWGVTAVLLLWLIARNPPVPAWPLARHAENYQLRAAPFVAAAAAAWIIVTNLNSDGDPVWLPYMPLLNPLDIGMALLFGAIALWWMSLTPELRARLLVTDRRYLRGIYAALAFLWLSASLVRALHYTMDTPLDIHGIRHSFLVQAGLSIFWGLLGFGAMLLATRLAKRELWLGGAGLMVVVVLKLFVVDLEGSGTLARIASFITIGALLLVTGYFSPLPPRRAEPDSSKEVQS